MVGLPRENGRESLKSGGRMKGNETKKEEKTRRTTQGTSREETRTTHEQRRHINYLKRRKEERGRR